MSNKLSDEDFLAEIEQLKAQSEGNIYDSNELSYERTRATYEYVGQSKGHLAPVGVSSIVDTSTTEVVDGYTAILSELLFDNNKIANFKPTLTDPKTVSNTMKAEDLVNHEIFTVNDGWQKMNTWVKSALLWKNSIIRWDWSEEYDYEYEEYDFITAERLDVLLSDDNVEVIGTLKTEDRVDIEDPSNPEAQLVYVDVKCRKKIDKSRVRINCIPHENFSIDRGATSLEDFSYIGITDDEVTKSDLRKRFPKKFTKKFDKWDELDSNEVHDYNQDRAARRDVIGTSTPEYTKTISELDENSTFTVTECWLYADRDGDGIAELRRVIYSGDFIIEDQYAESVNIASLTPIEIPHEFYGLSMADITRSSTLTSTAILRGFVENTYLTNFSPRLADPNAVDFSALQNMKPKQIIPTNGNPQGAVHMLQPENISPGTVPLLEHMQTIKEQANGLSKAAQGLNSELYVSGNSEAKLGRVQDAAQTRIQHVARRFVKTGIERLVRGVYETIRKNANESIAYKDREGIYATIDKIDLPKDVNIDVDANIGENSNQNLQQKYGMVAQILGQLKESGREVVINEKADAKLASMAILAMDMDPMDFIEDFNSDDFAKKAQAAREQATELERRNTEVEELKVKYEILSKEANARLLATQADNAMQDNAKQLAMAIDRHHQEWASLAIEADKNNTPRPQQPDIKSIMEQAYNVIREFGPSNSSAIHDRLSSISNKNEDNQNEQGQLGRGA